MLREIVAWGVLVLALLVILGIWVVKLVLGLIAVNRAEVSEQDFEAAFARTIWWHGVSALIFAILAFVMVLLLWS